MTTEVVLEGGQELIDTLIRMGRDVRRVTELAAQDGADVIARAANSRAPVQAIETAMADEQQSGSVTIDIGPTEDKWYLRFFEFGAGRHEIRGPLSFPGQDGELVVGSVDHPGMAAKPFLRPAFDAEKDAAVQAVGKRYRRVIDA